MMSPTPSATLFPYTTLFRSERQQSEPDDHVGHPVPVRQPHVKLVFAEVRGVAGEDRCVVMQSFRSEEHTSELQSHVNIVCRLLLEKTKYHFCANRMRARVSY